MLGPHIQPWTKPKVTLVLSTSLSSNMLKKKHNAITYHHVKEAVAASIVKVRHTAGTEKNVADILTKPTDGATFRKQCKSSLIILKA